MLYKDLRDRFIKYLITIFAILLVLWSISLIPIKNSDLEIMTFDVGNADCFLIKTPANEYIMIDTGKSGYSGGKPQAEYIVLKYLKDKGIKSIDTLIVTHFDNDHCGGAVDILSGVKVKRLYLNDLNHDSTAAKSIYREARINNVNIESAQNLQKVYDKADLKLINFVGKNLDNDNDNSIVTLLEYKDFKMLFTGDISVSGMNSIIKSIPRNITVLKVAHHGAVGSVSSELLKYLNPKYSIISVGENKFGHPSLYTLTLLDNTKILRTDINNAILIKVRDSIIKIYTYDLKNKKWIIT
jgi:competence protein ComEC